MVYMLFFSGKYMEKMKFSYLCVIKSVDNPIFKVLYYEKILFDNVAYACSDTLHYSVWGWSWLKRTGR